MRLFYTLGIYLYALAIRIASLKHSKAKKIITGRKDWKNHLALKNNCDKIWFHCASLGEYEQAKPIIKIIKNKGDAFIVSFFSPSGFEFAKDLSDEEKIYLPVDTLSNAKFFIDKFKITKAIFIKYEFWYNFLYTLKRKNVPYYFASCTFREDQIFFSPIGNWFKKHLTNASQIFLQNDDSFNLLKKHNFKNITKAGDTRFDRVLQIATGSSPLTLISDFKEEKKLIVIGSSWNEEEKLIHQYINNKSTTFKTIIAPHSISKKRLNEISELFPSAILYSKSTLETLKNNNILIIDNIGLLSRIYKFADIAIIGGAFGSGLHNILEAAVYGTPVIFGPYHSKFPEGLDIINSKGGFSIKDQIEFDNIMDRLIQNESFLNDTSSMAKEFVTERSGATKLISQALNT